jgi:YggT family protein
MFFIKAIIDICIVIFLLRLLIRSSEVFFDPINRLIYRITDPLLTPSRYITRDVTRGIFMSVLGLVALRGLVYMSINSTSFLFGAGISLLELLRLLFQGYMVFLSISILSQSGLGTTFVNMIQRAFIPLNRVSRRFGVPRRHFYLFVFLFLLMLYALLSFSIHYLMSPKTISAIEGLGEGLLLVVGLFQGFFSLIIIIGALLSWVSPDPYNPVVQAIYGISEPLLRPFRRFVPLLGGLDVSPVVAILCFQILGRFGQQLIIGLMM